MIKRILAFLIVLSLLVSAFCTTSFAEVANTISLDTDVTLVGGQGGEFAFVPPKDGCYVFSSSCEGADPVGSIYDDEYMELAMNDDCNVGDYNFRVGCEMEAGRTYYLSCHLWDFNDTDTVFTVRVSEAVKPTELKVSLAVSEGSYVGNYNAFLLETYPEGSYCSDVEWSIDNESVAYIDGCDDIACGIMLTAPGTVTVTASSDGLSSSASITCVAPPAIELDKNMSLTFGPDKTGETFSFVPEESDYYYFATNMGAEIGIHDEEFDLVGHTEYVDYDGEMLCFSKAYLEKGEFYLLKINAYYEEECTFEGYISKCPEVESLSVNVIGDMAILPDIGTELNISVEPPFAAVGELEWTVSDESIACMQYDEKGTYITFNRAGTVTVTVNTSIGHEASVDLTCKDVEEIQLYEKKDVTPADYNDYSKDATFKFVPEKSGTYVFMSEGNCDTVGLLFDSRYELIDRIDDNGYDRNFTVCAELNAGDIYYLVCESFSGEEDYTVTVTEATEAKSVTILEEISDTLIYLGMYGYFNFEYDSKTAVKEEYNICTDNEGLFEVTYQGSSHFEIKALQTGTCNIWLETKNGLVSEKVAVTISDLKWTVLELDKPLEITQGVDEKSFFEFTPEKSGMYSIYSTCEWGDPYVDFIDETMSHIDGDDDGGEHNNFLFITYLEEGETYYFRTGHYVDEPLTYTVTVTETKEVSGIKLDCTEAVMSIDEVRGFAYTFEPVGSVEGIAEIIVENEEVINLWDTGDGWFEIYAVAPGVGAVTIVTESGLTATVNIIVEEVAFADPLYGDANGDGQVNAIDTNILKRYIAGATDEIVEINADLNDDTRVDAIDANLLKRLVAGQ